VGSDVGVGLELENVGFGLCGLVIMAARRGMWVRLIMDAGLVEGAADGEGATIEDVGVDHGGGDVAVTEELLDGADVVARLEEVGGEAVPEGVAGGRFGEVSGLTGGVEGALEHCFVEVVASKLAAVISVVASCGEDPLPRPFTFRKWVLVSERARELNVARANLEICAVDAPDLLEVGTQRAPQGAG
jgi:hypothetical protein